MRLRAAACEDNRRAALRILAIANELDGCEREEAARLAGISDQALRDAIERFNAEGTAGLYDRPGLGRPRRLTPEQESEVAAAVLAGPDIASTSCSSSRSRCAWRCGRGQRDGNG
jgi:transposase